MKWIRKGILGSTNTENHKIAFKMGLGLGLCLNIKSKIQKTINSPKFLKIDCFKYFELKSIFKNILWKYKITKFCKS